MIHQENIEKNIADNLVLSLGNTIRSLSLIKLILAILSALIIMMAPYSSSFVILINLIVIQNLVIIIFLFNIRFKELRELLDVGKKKRISHKSLISTIVGLLALSLFVILFTMDTINDNS